jgi:hypothetical protein
VCITYLRVTPTLDSSHRNTRPSRPEVYTPVHTPWSFTTGHRVLHTTERGGMGECGTEHMRGVKPAAYVMALECLVARAGTTLVAEAAATTRANSTKWGGEQRH